MITRLIVRRLLFMVLVLFGLSLITFTLSHLVPANPARLIAGPRASASTVAKIEEEYGLDKPLPSAVCQLHHRRRHPRFWPLLFHPQTSQRRSGSLSSSDDRARVSMPFSFLRSWACRLALPRQSDETRWIDHLSRIISISGLALPVFWLALMVQFFFFGRLGSFPMVAVCPILSILRRMSRGSIPSTQ